MAYGRVKWFNDAKGFGFIETSDGEEVFVHYTSIVGSEENHKTLKEGQEVSYDMYEGLKGPQAKNVILDH
ncbi:MAG: cold-shock protein [Xanthomonadaceae bacterium]|nr:cold-shock protein [Xanthomonadaceae bacterium]